MGRVTKKIRKTIGLGGKTLDIDNNKFVLESIWPNGTWYLHYEDEVDQDVYAQDMERMLDNTYDRLVRNMLYKVYVYEERCTFMEKHTKAWWGTSAFEAKIPFDWLPAAEMIRRYSTDPNCEQYAFDDEDFSYILGRLKSINHLAI